MHSRPSSLTSSRSISRRWDTWFSIRVYPSASGISLTFRDITPLRTMTARHEGLLVRLLEAEDAERARIAADVHEDSLQALGAVTVQLQLLHHHLPSASPEVESLQAVIGELVMSATNRLRALVFTLEPTHKSIPIAESIRMFASQIFEGTSIHWSVDDVEAGAELPQLERSPALRIAREALSNARAHAEATEVIVTLSSGDDGLEIVVTDNGVAVDAESFVSAPDTEVWRPCATGPPSSAARAPWSPRRRTGARFACPSPPPGLVTVARA